MSFSSCSSASDVNRGVCVESLLLLLLSLVVLLLVLTLEDDRRRLNSCFISYRLLQFAFDIEDIYFSSPPRA